MYDIEILSIFDFNPKKKYHFVLKGMFLSESTDVFVVTPNRRTFFFNETENLKFGDF